MRRSNPKFIFVCNSLSRWGYLKGILRVLLCQSVNSHKKVKKLISIFFGLGENQVFLFGAGRMGVYTLLKALDLKREDEVIVAGYTCVVLTNAIKFAGCQVKYVDINTHTLNMDRQKLFESIGPSTKAIIIPHNFGVPDSTIKELKATYPEICIIEDVAHSFGSELDTIKCGKIGDAAFFSLEYSKPLTTGLGGILLVNNISYIDRVEGIYRNIPLMPSKEVFRIFSTLGVYALFSSGRNDFLYRKFYGLIARLNLVYRTSQKEISGEKPSSYPVKLSPVLSLFLIDQLKNLNEINNIKRAIVHQYSEYFRDFSDLIIPETKNQVLVRFPILFKASVSMQTLQKLKNQAKSLGYNFGEWFNDVVHPVGSFRYCYIDNSCKTGEFVASRIVNLPVNVNHRLSEDELKVLVDIFKQNGIK